MPGCSQKLGMIRDAGPMSEPGGNYSGMAPVTRASGIKRVVLARNRRLGDALYPQAFAALKASAGRPPLLRPAPCRRRHPPHRALTNRLVGILHGCPAHHTTYDEETARTDSRRTAAA